MLYYIILAAWLAGRLPRTSAVLPGQAPGAPYYNYHNAISAMYHTYYETICMYVYIYIHMYIHIYIYNYSIYYNYYLAG